MNGKITKFLLITLCLSAVSYGYWQMKTAPTPAVVTSVVNFPPAVENSTVTQIVVVSSSPSEVVNPIIAASSTGEVKPPIPPESTRIVQPLEKIIKKIVPPPPVKKPTPTTSTPPVSTVTLTKEGVLFFTNAQRFANGELPKLKANSTLDAAAEVRLKDMFDKQYFEHVSPDGTTPGAVGKSVGYDYLLFGENIALGNFKNDMVLVQAWMDSPEHRENILNTKFTEIGIAVGKGIYKGQETWIGVQDFGLPSSSCPLPNTALRTQIDSLNTQITALNAEATSLGQAIHSMNPQTAAEFDIYNEDVSRYNALVNQVNSLASTNKEILATYNDQVNAYNLCVK